MREASISTSGQYDFNPAVVQIITQVLRDLDVIDIEESPDAAQVAEGVFKLNGLVKGLETQTIHVWTEQEALLFLQPNQARYTLGGAAADHCTDADEWTMLQLTQSAAAYAIYLYVAPNATLVPVPYLATEDGLPLATEDGQLIAAQEPGQILGVAVGDNIGVVLDTGYTCWTTIAAVDLIDGLYRITLAGGLPSSASSGNNLFSYPVAAQITRPLKIPRFRLLTYASGGASFNETPMTLFSRQEYMDLPNKLSPGVPTQAFYTPQRDVGHVYVWPVCSTSAWGARFTWYRPLQDLLTPLNTMDFPQEWTLPLQWMLANEWRTSFSVPPQKSADVKDQAAMWYEAVSGWDRESEPVRFGIDYQFR